MNRFAPLVVVLLLVGGLVALVIWRLPEEAARGNRGPDAAPVEVATLERGAIREIRRFGGTLESPAAVEVAARLAGRVSEVRVDLGDAVARGAVVARVDDQEARVEFEASKADLAVARANQNEAESLAEIAKRAFDRVQTLQERGVSSESAFDQARSEALAVTARVEVARAQVLRAEAAVRQAELRLADASSVANWTGGDDERFVARRHVEEGDTVAVGDALVSIVELDPVRATLFVAERDYNRLRPGQEVMLTTDAWPGRSFPGEVSRVSPTFDAGSRQAEVQVLAANADRALRPGMFVRARAVLETAEDALLVPEEALTERDDEVAVFVLRGDVAKLVPVQPGIREAGRVELLDATGLAEGDRVVTLGQQLLDDGSQVTVPGESR